ncbi:HET domain-containing protein [Fusarium keratoplasticum]|nr:HET domain-containing protein [Fusarium keratoplasticum]
MRSHFIEAFIPETHSKHEQLSREIQHVRVSTSAEVSLTHTLNPGASQVIGRPERSLVAYSASGNIFQVFIAEECDVSRLPIPEIVEMRSGHFEINDPAHLGPLYTLFNENVYSKIQKAFARQGFDICDATTQLPSIKRYHSSLGSIPCPFNYDFNSNDYDDSEPYFGIHHQRPLKRGGRDDVPTWSSNDEDRRLPILYFADDYMTSEGEDEGETAVRSPRHHCERMISQLFEKNLGRAYNPVKHWTSPLREQNALADHQNASPFTLSGSGLSDRVTDFLMENRISNIAEWHNWRPTFHFELAVSAGGPTDSFEWMSTQLTRSLELRLPTDPYAEVHDVMVLIRVFNIYTQPEFQFFVNPWDLLTSGRIRFDKDCVVSAILQEAGPDSGALVLSSDSNTGPSGQWTTQTMSWDTKGKYSYKSLNKDEIRLLVLLPGQGEDLLRGVLYSTPFEQAGSYAAISYVWGEQTVKYKLHTPDGTLGIHASLCRALVHLRKSTGVTVLWADGICINQNDKDEKSHQVGLLPYIFQNASVTVAMIGYNSEMGSAVVALKNLRDTHVQDPESAELLPEDWEPKWALIAEVFNNCWF